MMSLSRILLIGLIFAAIAPPVLACNCPKEQMIKKYGTVSQIHPPVPAPPPAPEPAPGG
jgi:hypothetical protein